MYALTDAAEAELKRREREIVDAFLARKLTVAEAKAARARAIKELGVPAAPRLVRMAARRPPAALRRPRSEARPGGRRSRSRTARSASRDGPDEPPPEPDPPLNVIAPSAFRAEVARLLGDEAA